MATVTLTLSVYDMERLESGCIKWIGLAEGRLERAVKRAAKRRVADEEQAPWDKEYDEQQADVPSRVERLRLRLREVMTAALNDRATADVMFTLQDMSDLAEAAQEYWSEMMGRTFRSRRRGADPSETDETELLVREADELHRRMQETLKQAKAAVKVTATIATGD